MQNILRASPQHVLEQLSKLRLLVIPPNLTAAEQAAQTDLYVKALAKFTPGAAAAACEEMAHKSSHWPTLAEITQAAREVDEMNRPKALPYRPEYASDEPRRNDAKHRPSVRNPDAMRRKIAEMKAHPERFMAADALVRIGETMLARAGK